uniref:Uncharacterized protein n=1 Tax=Oryza meridionalis TaxID=40149 RepID=A0A0E0CXG9_9ORYZ
MAGHRNKDVLFVSWGEFARGLFCLAPGSPPILCPRCPPWLSSLSEIPLRLHRSTIARESKSGATAQQTKE